MATVTVRYIVDDVDEAIAFYTGRLGFREDMHPAPTFAMLSRGDLRLVLSRPSGAAGGGQAMPDGTRPEPGGWNQFSLEVGDLAAIVEELRATGVRFRNDIVTGVGGSQILLEDPAGNPIELFQPTRPSAWAAGGDEAEAAADVRAFVRATLPAPPARVLEIGAGDGRLARALTEAGYEVLAIDPEPGAAHVRAAALHDLDEPPAAFDAAIAIVSLHHVNPLAESLVRLARVLRPGAPFVIDEFDVGAFDRPTAEWWLEQQRALGRDAHDHGTPDELVAEHRGHLHPLDSILDMLGGEFDAGTPVRGAYLYRWDMGPSFRLPEEESIAEGRIAACGARLVAHRRA